jgi:rhodanese-related sulfurtransferase
VNPTDTLKKPLATPYATVRPREAVDLLKRGAVLLDVREPHEWRTGHARKARHIPSTSSRRLRSELTAGRPIVTVRRPGVRSRQAAALLAGEGRQVAHLAGGVRAWPRAGLPVVTKGGGARRVA